MTTINQVGVGLSGASGTGAFVGSTSPTITTPTISTINGVSLITGSGNHNILSLSENGSPPVNYLNIFNNAAGSPVTLNMLGSDTNIGFTLAAKGTGPILFQTAAASNQYTFYASAALQSINNFNFPNASGTQTYTFPAASGTIALTTGIISGSNPSSGIVGQLLSSAFATNVAQTTATPTQIQSLALTAGIWLVWGCYYTTVGAGTVTSTTTVQIGGTSASLSIPADQTSTSIFSSSSTSIGGVPLYCNTGTSLWNVSAGTTIYLNANTAYSVNTLVGNGAIFAQRVA